MTRIEHVASLSEDTVKRAPELSMPRSVKPAKRRRHTHLVETATIDPEVLREALRLACGDASRLTINGDGTVTVRNGKGHNA